MNSAAELLIHCRAAGLKFRRNGDCIDIRPARLITPELLARIRANKPGLLALLETEAAHLPPDCAPWLHIARQVLAGEFNGGDRSLLGSLLIGVRTINHPVCQQARSRLETLLGHQRKESRR